MKDKRKMGFGFFTRSLRISPAFKKKADWGALNGIEIAQLLQNGLIAFAAVDPVFSSSGACLFHILLLRKRLDAPGLRFP